MKGHISPGENLSDQIPHPQGSSEEIRGAMGEVRRGERASLAVVYGMDVEWVTLDNVEEREAGLREVAGLQE